MDQVERRDKAMQWEQVDRYHLRSDSGYRISTYRQLPSARRIYAAWPPRMDSWVPEKALIYTEDLEEAKAACEHHANQ